MLEGPSSDRFVALRQDVRLQHQATGSSGTEPWTAPQMVVDRVLVERTVDRRGASVEDVGIDHRHPDVLVAQELLDGANVVACFEEVGGEGMSEGVAGNALMDSCQKGRLFDGLLQGTLTERTSSRVSMVSRRLGLLARAALIVSSRGWRSTSRYRKRSVLMTWFGAEAATCSLTAR